MKKKAFKHVGKMDSELVDAFNKEAEEKSPAMGRGKYTRVLEMILEERYAKKIEKREILVLSLEEKGKIIQHIEKIEKVIDKDVIDDDGIDDDVIDDDVIDDDELLLRIDELRDYIDELRKERSWWKTNDLCDFVTTFLKDERSVKAKKRILTILKHVIEDARQDIEELRKWCGGCFKSLSNVVADINENTGFRSDSLKIISDMVDNEGNLLRIQVKINERDEEVYVLKWLVDEFYSKYFNIEDFQNLFNMERYLTHERNSADRKRIKQKIEEKLEKGKPEARPIPKELRKKYIEILDTLRKYPDKIV